MTQFNINDITKLYLYGQLSTPTNLVASILLFIALGCTRLVKFFRQITISGMNLQCPVHVEFCHLFQTRQLLAVLSNLQ